MTDGIGERLEQAVGQTRVHAHASLAPLTTFRVGGPADWLVEVRSGGELEAVLRIAREAGIRLTILGGGSNLLISDSGIRGVVVRMRGGEIHQPASDRVRADAAVMINGLVRWTISRGLAGLERWAGTPGTVGGAIFGNAHFRGHDIGELVARVRLLDRNGGAAVLSGDAMEFAYDASRLQRTGEILLWAEFHSSPGDPARLREAARESLAYRKRTQPLHLPSAGCIFQNPDPVRDRIPDGVPPSAGALIDRAGLKGHRIGGAEVSSDHANFIVNSGEATATEIRQLIDVCKTRVRDRFGIDLREEIVSLGAF